MLVNCVMIIYNIIGVIIQLAYSEIHTFTTDLPHLEIIL